MAARPVHNTVDWGPSHRRVAAREAYQYATGRGVNEHRVLTFSKLLGALPPGELLAAIATGALRRRQRKETLRVSTYTAPPLIAGESV